MRYLLILLLGLAGCTGYQASITTTELDSEGRITQQRDAVISMDYFFQDKQVKEFTFNPDTGEITLERFGSETSQVVESILNKIPIPP